MNPLLKQSQAQKDPSIMDEQEKKLVEKYGKLPMKKSMLSGMKERKYFDSGDYAMQQAGVASPDSVGSLPGSGEGLRGMEGLERATPERLPHAQPPSLSSSPTSSTMIPPTPQPAGSFSASQPPASPTPKGLPIPGGNASAVNHSPSANRTSTRSTSHSPSSHPALGSSPNAGTGGRPNNGSPSPSGGLSPSTSFGAGVAAVQGHSFSAKREGSGVGVSASKIGLSGSAVQDTARVSPPVSYSPLHTSGSVPPSSFPINHHHSVSQSSNPASPSNLRDPSANPFALGEGGFKERSGSISGMSSSPVKPSNLSLGIRRAEESAMEEE